MFDLLLQLYRIGGRSAVQRALTPPRKWVEGVTKKTGADLNQPLQERNEWAEEGAEFFESLVDKDFEDPD